MRTVDTYISRPCEIYHRKITLRFLARRLYNFIEIPPEVFQFERGRERDGRKRQPGPIKFTFAFA